MSDEKLQPDGWLKFVRTNGRQVAIPFRDIKSWFCDGVGVQIMYSDRRVILPMHTVAEIEVEYNSPEFVAQQQAEQDEVFKNAFGLGETVPGAPPEYFLEQTGGQV